MTAARTLSCFRDYVTLKLHFNSDIVWHPNLGDRISEDALNKRKDYVFFDKLAYQVKDRQERQEYLVSCFLKNPNIWIGECMEQDIKHFHRQRLMRVNSLTYTFVSEVDNIMEYMYEKGLSIKDLLLSNGQVPAIIADQRDIIGGVSEESLSLLDKAFGFSSHPTNDPLWKMRGFILSKYHRFLDIPKESMLKQLEKLASIEAKMPSRTQQSEK